MTRWLRFGIVALLLIALFGFGVHEDATYEERWPYPTSDELDADYDQYVGDQTLLFGTVDTIDGDRARIVVDHSTGSFEMTVTQFGATVQPGGAIQVYGTLGASQSIAADRIVVVNPASGSNLYKYAVSVVAVLAFLVAFFSYWRPNFDTLRLEARDDG